MLVKSEYKGLTTKIGGVESNKFMGKPAYYLATLLSKPSSLSERHPLTWFRAHGYEGTLLVFHRGL